MPEMPVSFRRLLVLVLIAFALVGCGGSEGSRTNCDLAGCTITFARDVGLPEVSVLGVSARLVSVDGGTATVDIAGNTVQLPVGAQTATEGFNVGVERITDSEVVVRVQVAAGG